MSELLRAASRVARSEATVLLTGETGTGKEVVARHIHRHSLRHERPMVPVNCGAIPEALLESELFGHTRGAFTGAHAARKGRVAMAEGGTLFLDEIGELPLAVQVKLLRLLQERTYEPVGSAESVTANFRLIVATNRDLEKEVAAGRFRADLFYRLNVCPMELPPLRDRRGDVSRLFTHFWSERGDSRPVETAVLQAIETYRWPGNVRELENLVERLSVCAPGESIRLADLPASIRGFPSKMELADLTAPREVSAPEEAIPAPVADVIPLPTPSETTTATAVATHVAGVASLGRLPVDLPVILRELEEAYIAAALQQSGGSKKLAADLLGLQRTTLVEKLRRRRTVSAAVAS